MRFLMMLADGFEEIEALGTLDLLRRGGLSVELCAVGSSLRVMGAHGIATEAQISVDAVDAAQYDGVILPGGLGGSQALAASDAVGTLVHQMDVQGKWIAAICAAPALVLPKTGVLRRRKVTCYPAPQFIDALGEQYAGNAVVVDENLITGEGPGRFAAFSRAILEAALGASVPGAVMREALFE